MARTESTVPKIARGTFRAGLRISPLKYTTPYHPSYVNITAWRARINATKSGRPEGTASAEEPAITAGDWCAKQTTATVTNNIAFSIDVVFCTLLPTFMLLHCNKANSKIIPAANGRTWPCATGSKSLTYSPKTIETAAKLPAVEIQSLH